MKREVRQAVAANRMPLRSCNRCGGIPAIVRTMLNSTTGRTIRMYECSCGERTWLEDDSG